VKVLRSIGCSALILVFGVVCASLLASGDWGRALLPLLAILVLLAPVRRWFEVLIGRQLPWFAYGGVIVGLSLVLYVVTAANRPQSVYLSRDYEKQFMEFYDEQMEDWPVPYETVYVETRYGRAHIITGGAPDAPPLLLCHAGALPSWSWKYNIEELNSHFRTYAVDAMGEVGKTVLYDVNEHTRDGHDIADLYCEILDELGLERPHVVGASYGGFIGANIAIHRPERVGKLVLIGPMGVTPTTGSTLLRITLLTLFPAKPVQDSFVDWMIAGSEGSTDDIVAWMRMVFSGARAKEAPPTTFTQQELAEIQTPVLLILGERDNLVGEPAGVIEHTRSIPYLETAVLDASHGIWAERAEEVDELIVGFLKQ
jgi:pimeloyl-ACP methyl ester carboxylesterase